MKLSIGKLLNGEIAKIMNRSNRERERKIDEVFLVEV